MGALGQKLVFLSGATNVCDDCLYSLLIRKLKDLQQTDAPSPLLDPPSSTEICAQYFRPNAKLPSGKHPRLQGSMFP